MVKWNGGSVSAVASRRASISTSHPRLAQGFWPTLRWRRFCRIRLSFDQRRAGAQPGVATVQIHPAPPPSPLKPRQSSKAAFISPLIVVGGKYIMRFIIKPRKNYPHPRLSVRLENMASLRRDSLGSG
jgi:hypothetical protein